MDNQNLTELFKGHFIGMFDMNGKPIHEGDSRSFLLSGRVCDLQSHLRAGVGDVLSSMVRWLQE